MSEKPTPKAGDFFGSCGHECAYGYQWFAIEGGPTIVLENSDGSREDPVKMRWICLCLPCAMCDDEEVPDKVERICRLGEAPVEKLPN